MGFPGGSDSKASAHNVGDLGSIPGLGRSPGEGNANQYSCLENSMDGGAWLATVHGVAKSRTRLGNFTFTSLYTFILIQCGRCFVHFSLCTDVSIFLHVFFLSTEGAYSSMLIKPSSCQWMDIAWWVCPLRFVKCMKARRMKMDSCIWYTPLRRLLEWNYLCKTKRKMRVTEFFKPLPTKE